MVAAPSRFENGISHVELKFSLELLKLKVKLLYLTGYFRKTWVSCCHRRLVVLPVFQTIIIISTNWFSLISLCILKPAFPFWSFVPCLHLLDVTLQDWLNVCERGHWVWFVIHDLVLLFLILYLVCDLAHFTSALHHEFINFHMASSSLISLLRLSFFLNFCTLDYLFWFDLNVFWLRVDFFKGLFERVFNWLVFNCTWIVNLSLLFPR